MIRSIYDDTKQYNPLLFRFLGSFSCPFLELRFSQSLQLHYSLGSCLAPPLQGLELIEQKTLSPNALSTRGADVLVFCLSEALRRVHEAVSEISRAPSAEVHVGCGSADRLTRPPVVVKGQCPAVVVSHRLQHPNELSSPRQVDPPDHGA